MAVRRMLVAGRYRLLDPVGAGGMGRVWLARDEMLDRDVAVKEFVPPDWMTDEEKTRLRDRTLREARSAGRLNHPHVVRVYDVVHWDGLPWIVMEYVASRSLHQVIKEDGPYTPAASARIGLAVLDALTAAHRAGVLHRDVKPHNVLIGDDGRVVLTDFGLATFVDDGSVTGPGLVVGSPQYVSPERARDGASTVASDLWSLGATLYAAVEGRSPYARSTAMATLMALATEPPDPPERAGLLEPVLLGLLRHEPKARLTGTEVDRRLRMIIATSSSSPVPGAVTPSAVGIARPMAESGAGEGTKVATKKAVPRQRKAVETSGPIPGIPSRAEGVPAGNTPRGRAHSRPLLVGAGALLVVLLGGGGILAGNLLHRDHPKAAPVIPAASVTTSPSPSSTPSPLLKQPSFSPVSCGAQPATVQHTPQPGAPREVNGLQIYQGWAYYTDPSGFHLVVPDKWSYWKVGTLTCFRDADGRGTISLDSSRNPATDPTAACRSEAQKLKAGLPSYHEVKIGTVYRAQPAADWEYTYADSDGTPMHAVTRWLLSNGKAFAVSWTEREVDWSNDIGDRSMMLATTYFTAPSR